MARKKKQKPGGKVKKMWLIFLAIWGFIILLFASISLGLLGFMPSFEELENPKSNLASEIYSSDQVLIGKYYIENRSNVIYRDLSPSLINALIATEDIRFEKHSGVDMKAIYRVVFGILTGTHRGGGSTISQQLAKNLFPRDKKHSKISLVFIKLKEWVTAIKLERNYTKQEILAMYLNTVDFGSQSFGIKSAAKTYFNKTPDSLKIEESALLIGMLRAPTYYHPVRNPENAKNRRNVVLRQVKKYGYITPKACDSLCNLPVDMSDYRLQDHTTGLAPYLREYLRSYLAEWCSTHYKADGTPYNLYKDGLKIHTTINSRMQQYAEEAVAEHIGKELQPMFYKHWKGIRNAPFDRNLKPGEIDLIMKSAVKRSERYRKLKKAGLKEDEIIKTFKEPVEMTVFSWDGEKDTIMTPWDSIIYCKWLLRAGLMAVEPQTGYVRAYVGGINYKHFQYDQVIMSHRQVGSTFKPFLYALAMQEGEFSPCSKVPNIPVSFELPDGDVWTPKNSDDKKEGEMVTLKWALANSVNYISAYLMKRYSPMAVINLVRKMGIHSEIPAVPSICLGTADLSLYEMVGAKATFANKGVYIEPVFITSIEDKNGNIVESFVPKSHEAMSEETAYLMISLMKGVVESGTGVRLRYKYGFDNPIAGKTGTTQNNSDGWFIGITPNLVAGAWVGCEDRSVHFRATSLGQGANTGLPIWALFMQKVYDDQVLNYPKDDFEKPGTISAETNCAEYEVQNQKKDIFDFD